MFIKDLTNNICFFDTGKKIPDVPTNVKIPDLTVPPHTIVGSKSGAYLIAQYCQILKFCIQDYIELTHEQIEQLFYINNLNINNYIKFTDGVDAAAKYMLGDVIYFKTIPFIKHFIHKYGVCLAELLPDLSICNTSIESQNNSFYCPELTGKMFSENLSKGFILCGYDDNGVLMQNTLGQSFGNKGFIKLEWSKLQQLLIKCACLKNVC